MQIRTLQKIISNKFKLLYRFWLGQIQVVIRMDCLNSHHNVDWVSSTPEIHGVDWVTLTPTTVWIGFPRLPRSTAWTGLPRLPPQRGLGFLDRCITQHKTNILIITQQVQRTSTNIVGWTQRDSPRKRGPTPWTRSKFSQMQVCTNTTPQAPQYLDIYRVQLDFLDKVVGRTQEICALFLGIQMSMFHPNKIRRVSVC